MAAGQSARQADKLPPGQSPDGGLGGLGLEPVVLPKGPYLMFEYVTLELPSFGSMSAGTPLVLEQEPR